MKCKVTYSCGHQGQVEVFGRSKDRESKLNWYKNKAVCPACYKAQKEAEIAKASEGLAQLTGTEKQVKWATQIRAEFVSKVKATIPSTAEGQKAAELLIAAVNEKSEAKWWIDNRANLKDAINPVYMEKAKAAGLA